MKRYTLFIVCTIGLLWFLLNITQTIAPVIPSPQKKPPIQPTQKSGKEALTYIINGESFSFSYFIVDQSNTIKLIPNLVKQASSISAAQEHTCTFLSSAGFYSTDSMPIGLFVTDSTQINPYQPNALLNGFFSVSRSGVASIKSIPPQDTPHVAIQSGPLLIVDGQSKRLIIRDDEPARRVVVAETSNHGAIFLVLYSLENTFKGPTLADVPIHLKEIEKIIHISIIHALNLDGGSASAFITHDTSITELTPVGSFFCVQ